MTEDVYISRQTSEHIYHTSEDCRRLEYTTQRQRDNLSDEWDECAFCSGEYDRSGGPSEIYLELAYE